MTARGGASAQPQGGAGSHTLPGAVARPFVCGRRVAAGDGAGPLPREGGRVRGCRPPPSGGPTGSSRFTSRPARAPTRRPSSAEGPLRFPARWARGGLRRGGAGRLSGAVPVACRRLAAGPGPPRVQAPGLFARGGLPCVIAARGGGSRHAARRGLARSGRALASSRSRGPATSSAGSGWALICVCAYGVRAWWVGAACVAVCAWLLFSGMTVMAFRARALARGTDGPVGPRATAVK